MADTRCGICRGLWSPFPCPHDTSTGEWCACGHHSHDHESDPSGAAGSPCWHGDSIDGYGYPINRCPCGDYNPTAATRAMQ